MGANSEILILGRSSQSASAVGTPSPLVGARRPAATHRRAADAAAVSSWSSRPPAGGRVATPLPPAPCPGSGTTGHAPRFSTIEGGATRKRAVGDDTRGRAGAREAAHGRVGARERADARASSRGAARARSSAAHAHPSAAEAVGKASAAASGALGWLVAHRVLAVAVVVVVAVGAFLYPPARAYYVASRNNAILAAKVADVNANNQQLQSQVDSLMTREGIEDAARSLGYVYEGGTAVDMSGVDGSSDGSSSSSTDSSTSSSVDTAWYTPMLDFLFSYDASTQGVS